MINNNNSKRKQLEHNNKQDTIIMMQSAFGGLNVRVVMSVHAGLYVLSLALLSPAEQKMYSN